MNLEHVMNRLIKKIESSEGDWIQPFNNSMPTNITNNTEYSGINIINLWIEAEDRGYKTNEWATFKQIKAMNGTVNNGEKGTTIFFFKPTKIKEIDEETSEETEKTIPMLKTYLVFNKDQTSLKDTATSNEILEFEELKSNLFVKLKHSNKGAFYSPKDDYINMPHINYFISSDFYYAVLLHELAHSTAHETRLNRDLSGRAYGTEAELISYAKEELIAETTRSFLQVKLGLSRTKMEEQNALYLKSWLKPLKENPKILWSIFSEASKAYNFILENTKAKEEAA
ncbi:MAG: hypothetical protein C0627_00915 [Sulfurimonas sp.]|nr:MAG: hypothetical protein C0627_00915 [Sulfurimonas sp.]